MGTHPIFESDFDCLTDKYTAKLYFSNFLMEKTEDMPTYKENEKVLCYHDKLLYEAKVCGFKFDKRTKEKMYQIHFIGWSKKWDIWTKHDCILSWTRENLRKKDELEKESDDEESITLKRNQNQSESHRKRAKRNNSEMSLADEEILYDLPSVVWDILQCDEKLSTTGNTIQYLGEANKQRELDIIVMLDEFKTYRFEQLEQLSERTPDQVAYLKSEICEFCVGMLALFDSLTPLQLLYPNDDQLPANIRPSQSCSIIHFCRFLTRLTQNLQEILVKSDCASTLRPFFDLFLPWFAEWLNANNIKERVPTFYRQ